MGQKTAPLTTPRAAILGLSPDSIGAITLNDLVNNEAALKLFLHTYSEYADENNRLTERIETLETELKIYESYRDGFSQKKRNARASAILGLIGTVLVAFGVNLSTPTLQPGGLVTLIGGAGVSLFSAWLALRD